MKVLITDMRHSSCIEEKRVLSAEGIEVDTTFSANEEELIRNGKGAFAFLVSYAKITRPVMEALPQLKVIIKYGIGVDNIDLKAATDLGKLVVNIPDYCTEEVALHALALILDGVRMTPHFTNMVRSGGWEIDPEPFLPYRLSRQLLGLLGFGRIARRLAFFMELMVKGILFYDPYLADKDLPSGKLMRASSAEEVFASSAVVSVHLPLNEETRDFVRARHFKQKNGIILVNTSRGGTIHKGDLLEALKSGQVAFFGSDVFFQEPPDRSDPISLAILNHPHSYITPHVAWCSAESATEVRRSAAEEALRVARGILPRNVVNKDVMAKLNEDYRKM